jgi:iron complex outermembrane receptor protein
MIIKLIILIFILVVLKSSVAQTSDSTIQSELDTIIIEAFRPGISIMDIPYSAEYIDVRAIERFEQGRSLDEILYNVPGVFVNNRYNPSLGDRINIRGSGIRSSFGVRGIKIILDNIPLTLADGQSQLNALDFGSMGSVEIIRGPSSSLYGNASGGVINIQTEKVGTADSEILAKRFMFQPGFIFGNYNFKKFEGKISGTIEDYSYLVNLSSLNFDGYREHSDFKSFSINSVMDYEFSSSFILKWILNYFNSPYALNPGSLTKPDSDQNPQMARDIVKQQGAGEQAEQLQSGLSAEINFAPESKFESSIYFITKEILNPIPGRIIDLGRLAFGARNTFTQKLIFDNFKLKITPGFDLEFQKDSRTEFENLGLTNYPDDPSDIFDEIIYGDSLLVQDEDVTGIGVFLQTEINYSSLTLVAGLRYDKYNFSVDDKFLTDGRNDFGERIFDKLSPSAGINYKLNDLTKLFINYSTSFQTPTTTELSNRSDGEGGFNPDLLPEEIYSIESGLLTHGLFNLVDINISAFYMNFTNLIIPFQVPGSEEVFFKNAAEAENKGFELSLDFFVFNSLDFNLAYSGYDFKFADYLAEVSDSQSIQLRRKFVPGIPAHKISFAINYQPISDLVATLKLIWSDKYFTNDFNGPQPGFNLPESDFINDNFLNADIRIGYSFKTNPADVEAFIGVNNIFDKRYNSSVVPNAFGGRFFEPAPDRNFFAGVRICFPGREF